MRKLVEAEPLFQEALQASRKVLGDEHADTLTPISKFDALEFAKDVFSNGRVAKKH